MVKDSGVFWAIFNGVGFQLNDLVDVFVGTGKGVTGNKAFPIKGRFKGVRRVERGEERSLCRPIVGSQKGRCPSFPPESCLKVKAFGSDVYGERKPLFFSKLTTKVQKRSSPPLESKPPPSAPSPAPLPNLKHPVPQCPQPYCRLMLKANSEVVVRKNKVKTSLKLVKRKVAGQVKQRYIFF